MTFEWNVWAEQAKVEGMWQQQRPLSWSSCIYWQYLGSSKHSAQLIYKHHTGHTPGITLWLIHYCRHTSRAKHNCVSITFVHLPLGVRKNWVRSGYTPPHRTWPVSPVLGITMRWQARMLTGGSVRGRIKWLNLSPSWDGKWQNGAWHEKNCVWKVWYTSSISGANVVVRSGGSDRMMLPEWSGIGINICMDMDMDMRIWEYEMCGQVANTVLSAHLHTKPLFNHITKF